MTNQSDSSTLSAVTIHFSLLRSSLVVVLADIAGFLLSVSPVQTPLISVIITFTEVVVLFLAFVYAGYELFTTVKRVLQNPETSSGVCTSAFLGSFLLGIIGILLAIVTQQNPIMSDVAIIVSIASLGSLLFFRSTDVTPERKVDNPPEEDIHDSPFRHDRLHKMSYPRLPSRLLYVVKEGEDACVISRDETRFVLSDGASASSLPRPWASLLGLQWIEEPLGNASHLTLWLEKPRQRWQQWVREIWLPIVNERNQKTGDYPVQQEDLMRILEYGASATLLGVEIDRRSHKWRAMAIGDTCLFIVRQTPSLQLIPILPMKRSTDFNLTPPLLNSHKADDANALAPYLQFKTNTYIEGDILLMATDALAQWLLVQKEQRTSHWLDLLTMEDQQEFVRFVEQQRQDGTMEEDDTTLLRIQL